MKSFSHEVRLWHMDVHSYESQINAPFLSRLCQGMAKVNALIRRRFKIIIPKLKVWRCFFAYGYESIETIN